MFYVMFKIRAAVFYRDLKPRGQPSGFRPDKTLAASFLNYFKNIPGKACVKRCFCERWKLAYEKNIKHRILIRRRFYRVLKSLHVLFYRPFDRSTGLRNINEFLKTCYNSLCLHVVCNCIHSRIKLYLPLIYYIVSCYLVFSQQSGCIDYCKNLFFYITVK